MSSLYELEALGGEELQLALPPSPRLGTSPPEHAQLFGLDAHAHADDDEQMGEQAQRSHGAALHALAERDLEAEHGQMHSMRMQLQLDHLGGPALGFLKSPPRPRHARALKRHEAQRSQQPTSPSAALYPPQLFAAADAAEHHDLRTALSEQSPFAPPPAKRKRTARPARAAASAGADATAASALSAQSSTAMTAAAAASSAREAPAESSPSLPAPVHNLRPKSAFLFFMGEHRAKFHAAFPELSGSSGKRKAATQAAVEEGEEEQQEEEAHAATGPLTATVVPAAPAAVLATALPDAEPQLEAGDGFAAAGFSSAILDVAKVLGFEWRRLTPQQKQPYEEASRRDKERYRNEKIRQQQQARLQAQQAMAQSSHRQPAAPSPPLRTTAQLAVSPQLQPSAAPPQLSHSSPEQKSHDAPFEFSFGLAPLSASPPSSARHAELAQRDDSPLHLADETAHIGPLASP